MPETKHRGRFVWHDLMTRDEQAAIAFYTKVVGWGTQVWDGPKPYTMWTADKTPVGGVMGMPPGEKSPPHWLGYISTPNVDATVADATRRGASTHVPPTDIPTIGRFAVLQDPQGGSFAVFSPMDPSTAPSASALGGFSWHEIATTDPVAAFDFYQSLFGWDKTSAMDMGELGVYQMFGFDGVPFGGVFKQPAEMPGPPSWVHYIKIDNVPRVVEIVKSNGGQVLNGPMEVPGGDWIANCMDPQGGVFAVHAAKQ